MSDAGFKGKKENLLFLRLLCLGDYEDAESFLRRQMLILYTMQEENTAIRTNGQNYSSGQTAFRKKEEIIRSSVTSLLYNIFLRKAELLLIFILT